MNKHKIAFLLIIGCISIVLVIAILLSLQTKNTSSKLINDNIYMNNEDLATNVSVQTRVISKDDEQNQLVRSEISQGNYAKIDSMGIKNSLPSDYNESTPFIEIRSFERKLNGSIQPFYLYGLGVHCKNQHAPGGGYGIDGYGLRVGLEQLDKREGLSELLWDTEYTAFGQYHLPGDPNYEYEGITSKVSFRTPKSLAPGEVYQVDLILIDRIKEKSEQEHAIIAKEEQTRIEMDEAITIQISEYPKINEPGILDVGYHDGNKSRTFQRLNSNTFVLKGPNKLGGEIVVAYNSQNASHIWFYIKDVQKRKLKLPEDAFIVLNEDEMSLAKVSLAQIDPNILSDKEMIAFYPDVDANYFFFWIMLDHGGLEKIQDNNWQTELKVLPGTYNVRLLEDLDTYSDVGNIEFTNESGKTYSLNLK